MTRSFRLRWIPLALTTLFLVSLPTRAEEPKRESLASVAARMWQALLDTVPGLSVRLSSGAAASTTSAPNLSGADTDRGADLDPDGFAADSDRGASLDPDGLAADTDRGASLDPNG